MAYAELKKRKDYNQLALEETSRLGHIFNVLLGTAAPVS
jgi:hypothetical protein